MVVSQTGGQEAIHSGGLTVVAGGSDEFVAQLVPPGASRPGRLVDLQISYSNRGMNDIVSPILTLRNYDDVDWIFPGSERIITDDTLRFLALSSSGPAGILRPGQTETITVRMRTPLEPGPTYLTLGSSGAPDQEASDIVIDWSPFEDTVKLPFQADDEWNVLWETFTNRLGHTWREVAKVLADRATAGAEIGPLDYFYDNHVSALIAEVFAGGSGLLDTTGPWVTDHTWGESQSGGGTDYVQVTFNEQISGSFFDPDDVHVTGPNGTIDVTGVSHVTNSVWRIDFSPQVGVGQYHVLVGPQIVDLADNSMDQDHDGSLGEIVDDAYDASFRLGSGGNLHDLHITGFSPRDVQSDGVSFVEVYFSRPVLYGTFTPADVAMAGPGGNIAVSDVKRISSSVYQIEFPEQTEIGSYTLLIGSHISDLRGISMNQDLDATRNEGLDDSYVVSFKTVDTEGPRVIYHSPAGVVRQPVSSVELQFSEQIRSSSFTPDDVSLIGPSGSIAVTDVVALNNGLNGEYRISFAPQFDEGDYTFTVGPNIIDFSGNPMDQNFNEINGEAGDVYDEGFSVLPPSDAMVISGKVTYSGTGSAAHVLVQVWEENGGSQDDTPGTDDDVLINEMQTQIPANSGSRRTAMTTTFST